MTFVLLIIAALWLKAFGDAIRFAKVYEPCHELWHASDWLRTYLLPIVIVVHFRLYNDVLLMVALLMGSFSFNILYKIFRLIGVYRFDDKYRIKWLGKILEKDGII